MADDDRALPFQALDRPRAFEEILSQIERAIASKELASGDKLPSERELAETFRVSRSSVREALRVLEMFGVVVARRGTGPDAGSIVASGAETGLVSALRMHSALLEIPSQDLVEIRILIEAYAAGRAAELGEKEKISRLRDLVTQMDETSSAEAFHGLDTEFHVALGAMSGNVLLPVLMEALRGSMEREMISGYARMEDWEKVRRQLIAEHSEITEKIELGEPRAAEEMLRRHILRFYRIVLGDEPAPGS
jgi:GntR family transcriptional regulator, transcriptional repressor for pyruvate dehydrogenase complex